MRTLSLFLIGSTLFMVLQISSCSSRKTPGSPNIIFGISDDQGYPYASAYGTRFVNTPGCPGRGISGIVTPALCA